MRLTVGKLLIAIAVVAANCGGLRQLYESHHGTEDDLPILIFGVGLLPLINVALIGTLLLVGRKLRSFHSGSGENPGFSPAGGTYFSLHLLMIVCLVSYFMPDEWERYLALLGPVIEYAEMGWGMIFSRYGDLRSWVVLFCSMAFVFISVPLLLLTWIGQRLARYCAATLPRSRFRIMSYLVSLGFASVALAICVTPKSFSEERDVPLSLQVVEKASGRPIGAAFLRITDPFLPSDTPPRALTGADGRVQLVGRFKAVGRRNAFRTMGGFSTWGRWLEVSASAYQATRIPLGEVLGAFADLENPRPRKIRLVKGAAPRDLFLNIAGTYSKPGNGYSGWTFIIEPDGRFVWSAWGCMPPDIQEYGYLKRSGDEIELMPIRHPGEEVNPVMPLKYRSIAWGERLYLSTTEDRSLQSFCRAGLTSNSNNDAYWGYVRVSDSEKPRTGMPRLPGKVWFRFLLDELSLRNEDGILRRAIEPVLPKKYRNDREPIAL